MTDVDMFQFIESGMRGGISYIPNRNGEANNSGAPARALRARSGAPWVRKFGKLSIRENLVMT